MNYYYTMHTITFIYRIDKSQQTYFGKYMAHYISDDHSGLDTIIRPKLTYGLNKHRRLNNKNKLKQSIFIGILSYSNDFMNYSSEKEVRCFDFLYEQYKTNSLVDVEDYWVNGELLSNLEKEKEKEKEVQISNAEKEKEKSNEEFVELFTSV